MNFICDTDIISSIGKIERIDILKGLFPKGAFNIPEQVHIELSVAKELGFEYPDYINSHFNTVSLVESELKEYTLLLGDEKALGKGELQCIVIAKNRFWTMLTNDRLAKNKSREFGIKVWDILDILKAHYVLKNYSKTDINAIFDELEKKDGMKVKQREIIFK